MLEVNQIQSSRMALLESRMNLQQQQNQQANFNLTLPSIAAYHGIAKQPGDDALLCHCGLVPASKTVLTLKGYSWPVTESCRPVPILHLERWQSCWGIISNNFLVTNCLTLRSQEVSFKTSTVTVGYCLLWGLWARMGPTLAAHTRPVLSQWPSLAALSSSLLALRRGEPLQFLTASLLLQRNPSRPTFGSSIRARRQGTRTTATNPQEWANGIAQHNSLSKVWTKFIVEN